MSTTVGVCPQWWGYVHNGGGMSTTMGVCLQRWGYVHNGGGMLQARSNSYHNMFLLFLLQF